MTEVGETEFAIYDEWGQGIPLTDSMQSIITAGMTVMSVMAVVKDIFEEVLD